MLWYVNTSWWKRMRCRFGWHMWHKWDRGRVCKVCGRGHPPPPEVPAQMGPCTTRPEFYIESEDDDG